MRITDKLYAFFFLVHVTLHVSQPLIRKSSQFPNASIPIASLLWPTLCLLELLVLPIVTIQPSPSTQLVLAPPLEVCSFVFFFWCTFDTFHEIHLVFFLLGTFAGMLT